MPAKVNIGALLRKQLGKKVADAMAAKINKMLSEKKSAAQIEKVIHADLIAHVEKVVTAAVITKIGPVSTPPTPPFKNRPIGGEVITRRSVRAPK